MPLQDDDDNQDSYAEWDDHRAPVIQKADKAHGWV